MNNIIEGLLLGFSVNPGCLAVCSPFLVPFFLSEKVQPAVPVLKFLSGRLLAYIFFAFASGFMSIYFDGRIKPLIFAVFQVVLSIWLILFAVGRLTFKIPFCHFLSERFIGKNYPFFAGIVLGLNICPPFLLGLNKTLQMKSVIMPVLFFLGFFLGSSLWVTILLFSKYLAEKKFVVLLGRIAALAAGFWFVIDAVKILSE